MLPVPRSTYLFAERAVGHWRLPSPGDARRRILLYVCEIEQSRASDASSAAEECIHSDIRHSESVRDTRPRNSVSVVVRKYDAPERRHHLRSSTTKRFSPATAAFTTGLARPFRARERRLTDSADLPAGRKAHFRKLQRWLSSNAGRQVDRPK
jgi:hypothetical protein